MDTELLLTISKWVAISGVSAILIWDLFAQIRGGLKSTVSWAVWGWCKKAPFVPFLVGFVCGHLFWGGPDKEKCEMKDE